MLFKYFNNFRFKEEKTALIKFKPKNISKMTAEQKYAPMHSSNYNDFNDLDESRKSYEILLRSSRRDLSRNADDFDTLSEYGMALCGLDRHGHSNLRSRS